MPDREWWIGWFQTHFPAAFGRMNAQMKQAQYEACAEEMMTLHELNTAELERRERTIAHLWQEIEYLSRGITQVHARHRLELFKQYMQALPYEEGGTPANSEDLERLRTILGKDDEPLS